MRFGCVDPLPPSVEVVYRLDVNEYQGLTSLQLVLERCEAAATV